MNSEIKNGLGWLLVAAGHLAAVAGIATGITLLIMPLQHARNVAGVMQAVPDVWAMSTLGLALHVGLAACVWALVVIIYKLGRLRVDERRQNRSAIKLSRGSVMTETLVILPIFFMLTFGMGQLAINNITGILANVAVYEAARAAWIWKPEEEASGKRMGITSGIAADRCRIAVAFVMTPVAPGEYLNIDNMSNAAQKARVVALGANVPLMGTLSTFAPAAAQNAFAQGLGLASILGVDLIASEKNLTYNNALDSTTQFWLRTIRKFTHAYSAAKCTINSDHSVKMEYKHQATMPVVRRIFGSFDIVGTRPGSYAKFEREFGFAKQANTPNNKMPKNNWINPPSYSGGFNPKNFE